MGVVVSRKQKVSRRGFLRYALGGTAAAMLGCGRMTQRKLAAFRIVSI